MRTALLCLVFALLAGCTTTRKQEPPSPLASVEEFYAAPVVYDFEIPADWELPDGEFEEKTDDFNEAWFYRLEVTRRASIQRYNGEAIPPNGAAIELFITEIDLGFHGGIVRKPAICIGELLFTGPDGEVLESYDVRFKTPNDAGWQWYTYGGRLESAHDAFAVDVIDIIQRAQR